MSDKPGFDIPLDGSAGPARRLPAGGADALIASALDAAAVDAPESNDAPATASGPASGPASGNDKRPRRPFLWLAVALLFTTSAVSAAVSAVVSRATVEPALLPVPAAPVRPAVATEPPMETVVVGTVVDESTVLEDLAPAAQAPTERERQRIADDLLQRANRARRDRRWRRADSLYDRVRRQHPGTRAATVAAVSSAAIRLEQLGDPAGALALYRRAARQAPRGPVAEEARFGLAEAYRRLGDTAAERAALTRFVRRHPRSLLIERARARLVELESAGGGAGQQ